MTRQISRRHALKSAAAAAVGVAVADLLAACGSPAAPAARATTAPTTAALTTAASTTVAAATAPAAGAMTNALGITLPADALPLEAPVVTTTEPSSLQRALRLLLSPFQGLVVYGFRPTAASRSFFRFS